MGGRHDRGEEARPRDDELQAARTRRSPDERRAQLVAAAHDLILTKGIASTSVSDIVRGAGVAQGTFYLYFASKDEIINAVAEQWVSRWHEEARRIAERSDLNGVEKLLGILAARALSGASSDKAVAFYQHVHRPENRAVHDELARQSQRVVPLVERAIREGVDQGLFATPFPAEAGLWVVATLAGAEVLLDPTDPGYDALRWVTSYADFILRALGCTAPPERIEEFVRAFALQCSSVGRR